MPRGKKVRTWESNSLTLGAEVAEATGEGILSPSSYQDVLVRELQKINVELKDLHQDYKNIYS